jgi:hypothetical protein
MLESTLEEALLKDIHTSKIYGGVLSRDELPNKVGYPSCYIINTKPRLHKGEHWLAVFYDKNGYGDFFDSYGQHPSHFMLASFMDRTAKTWSFNKRRIQGLSSFCGFYCLLYLFCRSRNNSIDFFRHFGKNTLLNDRKVQANINKYNKN